ncbi:hypothetical protein ACE1B6_27120 [Aerosakkonemataceae cyanobacterium BLCC-F154]|uniref:Uncharacterized protein n=1 Tax=Floridaenema fluviatile BLCC-F154 TaxID=3153640 RepID=A0ABV4YKA3_9CYAN
MALNPVTSACKSCRYYTPEGRRGGNCQQLGVPVRGGWKACSLALPPFAPSWESLEEIFNLQSEVLKITEVMPKETAQHTPVEDIEPKYVDTYKASQIETMSV